MVDECLKPGAQLKHWLIFKELINYSMCWQKMLETG